MRLTPTALAAGFALVLPALPVSAATLTVTGVAHTGGVVQFDVPTVEVEDGNLDEATIRAIFNGDVKVGAPALSDLDAKAIRIPTITMKTSQPGAPATVYHDVEILDVVDGIAGSAVLGGTDVTGDNDVKVTLGKIAVSNLDIGALLSFYGLGGDTPPTFISMAALSPPTRSTARSAPPTSPNSRRARPRAARPPSSSSRPECSRSRSSAGVPIRRRLPPSSPPTSTISPPSR
jgi:hypothetical protein